MQLFPSISGSTRSRDCNAPTTATTWRSRILRIFEKTNVSQGQVFRGALIFRVFFSRFRSYNLSHFYYDWILRLLEIETYFLPPAVAFFLLFKDFIVGLP